jgi:hypothetical protein
MGWDYQYTTASEKSNDFNSAFALSDKVVLEARITDGFKAISTVHLYTFQDFDGQTHNVYRDSIGLNYAPWKELSFDWFYSYKNGELNDIVDLQGGHYQLNAGLTWHF